MTTEQDLKLFTSYSVSKLRTLGLNDAVAYTEHVRLQHSDTRESSLMGRTKSLFLAFSALLLTGIAVAPSASADTGALPTQVVVAGQHSSAGYLTDADRTWLLANPYYGAMIVDPAKTRFTTSPAVQSQSAAAAAASCTSQDLGQTAYNALGSVAYKYNTHIRWCWSGSTVTSVPERYGYFSNLSGYQTPGTVLVDQTNAGPGTQKTAVTQQSIANCVPQGGCVSNHSPRNVIIMQPNGFSKPTFYS